MELGLSLGDASKTAVGFLKESKSSVQDPKPIKMTGRGLNFCMALGLNSSPPPPDKPQLGTEYDDDADDDADQISHGDDESDDHHHHHAKNNPLLQLNLLPLVPVNPRRQIIASHLHSLPWSSDNGSSENGSSGNMAAAARRRVPGEEVSSANSQMDLGGNLELMGGGSNKKRSSEDEDENALNARKKLRLSKQQSAFLEESFKEHHTLNPKQKQALAKELSLRPRQVEVWFQNRRARTKLKQTEVDCEYLKRCCDTLTEENRRLHKELGELRSLNKNQNPFYIQPPATTLTMCPSCERVIASSARPTFYPPS